MGHTQFASTAVHVTDVYYLGVELGRHIHARAAVELCDVMGTDALELKLHRAIIKQKTKGLHHLLLCTRIALKRDPMNSQLESSRPLKIFHKLLTVYTSPLVRHQGSSYSFTYSAAIVSRLRLIKYRALCSDHLSLFSNARRAEVNLIFVLDFIRVHRHVNGEAALEGSSQLLVYLSANLIQTMTHRTKR